MATDPVSSRVSRMKSDAERSLRALSTRLGVAPPASRGAPTGPRPPQSDPVSFLGWVPQSADSRPASLDVNVNLAGGTIFLDDERRTRALAKEIKRLISEDQRRGLTL